MPAPLDLTGQRFGRLTALRPVKRADRAGRWWECKCECGGLETVPMNRLRVPDSNPRALRACAACRSRHCIVCGAAYLTAGSAKTCGDDDCRREAVRLRNRVFYHSSRLREGALPRVIGERSRIARADPIIRLALIEARREQQRLARLLRTPDERQERNRRQRERYAQNPEKHHAYVRRWLAEMSPERREAWEARARERERAYRNQKAQAEMMADAARLVEMMEKNDD